MKGVRNAMEDVGLEWYSGTRETGEAPGVGGEQDRRRRSHRKSKGRRIVQVSGRRRPGFGTSREGVSEAALSSMAKSPI